MELKIQCDCGTRYSFDVEPVNGQMPFSVQCPGCKADGTNAANALISQSASAPAGARLRAVAAAPVHAAAAIAEPISAQAYAYEGHSALLNRTSFFIKERVGLLKLTDTYDILDPVSGAIIGIAKEEPPTWAKLLRLAIDKRMLPTSVNIYEQEGLPPVASIHRGFSLFRSRVKVVTGDGQQLGYFKRKFISLGGGFNVFDNQDQQVAEVKGNWKGWDFKFLSSSGREIGTVNKKWAGLGKELFTSADNYMISLTDLNGASPVAATLLLAAGLAIDTVFKESK